MDRPRVSDRVALLLCSVLALIVAVYLVVCSVHKATARIPADILNYLHLNTELAFAAWFNASLLLIVGLLAGSLAYAATGTTRVGWSVVAVTTAYLSVDEATGLHETAGGLAAKVPALDNGSFYWVVPGAVVALIGVAVLVRVTRPLEARVRGRLGLAMTTYLVGALGVEIITGLLLRAFADVWAVVNVLQPALVVLEESLEMLACIYAIWALLRYLEDHPGARPTLVSAQSDMVS